jgi:tetratricopeptide (TPR) repeat protein
MNRSSHICIFLLATLSASAQQPSNSVHSAKALGTKESTPMSGLSEAQRLLDKGQIDEALKATDVLTKERPEPGGVERLRGKGFYLKANLEDANSALQKAIAQDPNDKEALQIRGVTLFKMGRPQEAIPLLEQAHGNLTNLNIDGRYVLALCYMTVNRYDESRHYFATLYGLQADTASSYLLFARMLLRWQNPSAAQEMVRKALALNPDLPLAHLVAGQIALGNGNFDDALGEFLREAAINPMYGSVYDRLGDTYLQKNQYEKAREALNRALLLEPDTTGPYILLGQVLLKQNNPTMAANYLQHAVQMDPRNKLSHFFLGQAYRTMGKKQDAIHEFETAEKISAAAGHGESPLAAK